MVKKQFDIHGYDIRNNLDELHKWLNVLEEKYNENPNFDVRNDNSIDDFSLQLQTVNDAIITFNGMCCANKEDIEG